MNNKLLENIKVYRGNPLLMGVTVIGDEVNFAITAKYGSNCQVVLYEKGKDEEVARIPFENAQVIGNVYAMSVSGLDYSKYYYNFSVDGEIVTDEYAKALSGKKNWGKACDNLKGIIINDDYDWQQDAPLNIPFDENYFISYACKRIYKACHIKGKTQGNVFRYC